MMLAIERGVEKAVAEKIGKNYNHNFSNHELFRMAISTGVGEAVKASIKLASETPIDVRRELVDAFRSAVRDGIVEAARLGYIKA
jgi:hypothetical protein